MVGRRVMVVGTTGSGKSTLAGRLAARLEVQRSIVRAATRR